MDDLRLSQRELRLQHIDLLLEGGDGPDAAVDRISHPRVRLVHHAAHRVAPLVLRQLLRNNEPSSVSTYREIFAGN